MSKTIPAMAWAIAMTAGLFCSSAVAGPAAFTAIGASAEYRIDGVRSGFHKGAEVRFLDITLKNLAPETTFAGSIVEVWWQGRTVGGKVQALKRDGQPFGMHGQYIRQGDVVAVSYPVPVRDDVAGVTLEFEKPGDGPKKRILNWADIAP